MLETKTPHAVASQETRSAADRFVADRAAFFDGPYSSFGPRGAHIREVLHTRFLRLMGRNAQGARCRYILDLGGGQGGWCRYLADLFHSDQVYNLDLNQGDLLYARRLQQGLHCLRADMVCIPCADASFDVVSAQVSLMFLTDDGARRCAREVARVLRPGGLFVIQELREATRWYDPHRRSFGYLPRRLRAIVTESGFEYRDYMPLWRCPFGLKRLSTAGWLGGWSPARRRFIEALPLLGVPNNYFLLFGKPGERDG